MWPGRMACQRGPGSTDPDQLENALSLCAELGMDGGKYQAVHYEGEAVRALPMQERMTLANMTAELGGQAGLISPVASTPAISVAPTPNI